MKPQLEKIQPNFGSSFKFIKFTGHNNNSARWHFHPEYEIVYISTGKGKRQIADSISYYENGDLIFLGPNLPHFGFCNELTVEHTEVVIQMKEDFLGEHFLDKPEMANIKQLFERSKTGLSFYGQTKKNVGRQLIAMEREEGFKRTLSLLEILHGLAETEEYSPLSAKGKHLEVNTQDQERMDTVYQLVQENFQETIPLETVAKAINMSVPAFCRYFKKVTHGTFTQFVNEYKITHACRLMQETDMTILGISLESGFANLSHFNKQFKEITRLTPSEYREQFSRVVGS